MNPPTLRSYQFDAVESVFREWEKVASTMVVMATGLGKTVTFCEIVRRIHPKRSIIIAHRNELINQAVASLERIGMRCEIEMAESKADASMFHADSVIVASVQTLNSGPKDDKRMAKFRPEDFELLVVDEFHHGVSPSYKAVIEHFRKNPSLKVLGVTATPDRLDAKALGQICESVAYKYDIAEACSDGYLVPIEQQMVHINSLDFSSVRTTAGDLNGGDLAAVMEDEKNLQGMVGASIKIIGNRSSIAFTSSVRHAEMCCDIFNRHRAGMAAFVSGTTPEDDRKSILKKFKNGEIQVICNVGIATEGFDAPATECIIVGRPTKSRALYTQMIGRGTRALPGVLDGMHSAFERCEAIACSPKPSCIAEGTLILTDYGLVPIEHVTSEMKCWDGVDFVTNSGVVFRGEKNVITYAGLTATEDHRVWTKKGWQTFGKCAAKQIPICVAALGWKEVRETDRYYRGGDTDKQKAVSFSRMSMRGKVTERFKQYISGCGWMPEVWTTKASSQMALSKMPVGSGKVYEPKTKTLSEVWWSGHTFQFLVPAGNGDVDSGEFGTKQGNGNRPNRQRRSLRSGKPSVGYNPNSGKQQAADSSHAGTPRIPDSASERGLLGRSSKAIDSTRKNVEGDSGKPQTVGSIQRKVKVFDILNCGPRHRFTAAGLLVSNCLVLDFVGNSGKHKLMTTADVLGGNYDEETRDLAVSEMGKSGNAVRMADALKKAQKAIQDRIEAQKRAEAARRAKLIAEVKFSTRNISPFDVFDITPKKDSKWDKGRPLSEGQKNVLRKMGVNPDEMEQVAARQLLHKYFERREKNLCTFAQGKLLLKSGWTQDEVRKMSFNEASSAIDGLKRNNWKRTDVLALA